MDFNLIHIPLIPRPRSSRGTLPSALIGREAYIHYFSYNCSPIAPWPPDLGGLLSLTAPVGIRNRGEPRHSSCRPLPALLPRCSWKFSKLSPCVTLFVAQGPTAPSFLPARLLACMPKWWLTCGVPSCHRTPGAGVASSNCLARYPSLATHLAPSLSCCRSVGIAFHIGAL
jgi:hypothetical protein